MKSENQNIILLTAFGMIGSIIIGLIFNGTLIFDPYRNTFQFIPMGLFGAIFFALLKYRPQKEQVFAMISILIINLVLFTGKAFTFHFLLRDVCFLGALFISVYLYYKFINKYPSLFSYLRVLALVFIYTVMNIIAITIIFLFHSDFPPPLIYVFTSARFGILIGLGMGLGLDLFLSNHKMINRFLNTRLHEQ